MVVGKSVNIMKRHTRISSSKEVELQVPCSSSRITKSKAPEEQIASRTLASEVVIQVPMAGLREKQKLVMKQNHHKVFEQ